MNESGYCPICGIVGCTEHRFAGPKNENIGGCPICGIVGCTEHKYEPKREEQ